MKKLFPVFLLFILISSFSVDKDVYICDSKTSVAYHSTETCRDLNRCSHRIIKVSKADAVRKYGKRACKICY